MPPSRLHMAIVDQLQDTIKTLSKPIEEVLKYPPGPRRWRAAHDLLWLNLSWKNQQIYKEVCEANKITRDNVDKFGQAVGATRADKADKTLRNCLSIPAGAYHVISKSDPDLFRNKANEVKFFKEFREYATREVY